MSERGKEIAPHVVIIIWLAVVTLVLSFYIDSLDARLSTIETALELAENND